MSNPNNVNASASPASPSSSPSLSPPSSAFHQGRRALQNRMRQSLGVKFFLVCILVLLMAIPAMFISVVSFERSKRSDNVAREVASRYGAEQYVTGPVLVAPYGVADSDGHIVETGQYVVFADEGTAEFDNVQTTIRKRSLFKVPTYSGKGTFSAQFSIDKANAYESGIMVDWSKSELWMGVSDTRGLQSDVTLTTPDGDIRKFTPAKAMSYSKGALSIDGIVKKAMKRPLESVETANGTVVFQDRGTARKVEHHRSLLERNVQKYISVSADDFVSTETPFTVSAQITLAGTQRLGVMPFAKSTRVTIASEWPDPGFEGGFAPIRQDIDKAGFSAEWHVPFLARGIAGTGLAHTLPLYEMSKMAMSVKFVSTQHPYRTVNRALKYSIMFIGLVFFAYFLFEVVIGVRVHPAQYLLIGLAQSIFYLLLLAFSERVGFTIAFLVAAVATISITAGYAGAVFGARKYIIRAGLVFIAVYALLYVLMRVQDFALMIGALSAFVLIALVMYLTRNVDWYGDQNRSEKNNSEQNRTEA